MPSQANECQAQNRGTREEDYLGDEACESNVSKLHSLIFFERLSNT